MIKWFLKRLSWKTKKILTLFLLEDILKSKTSSIDNATAEKIITMAVKSRGNKVTGFTIKD